jgi:hypothetical protein
MNWRNKRIGEDRGRRWRGNPDFLHAEPRQTIGNTHLVPKTRQSGVIK